jgi:hypothetical protein
MNRFVGALLKAGEETDSAEYAARLNVAMALTDVMCALPRPRRVWKFRVEPRHLSASHQAKASIAFDLYDEYRERFMNPWYAKTT